MLEKHEANKGELGRERHRDTAVNSPAAGRKAADREVPVPGVDDGRAVVLNNWLDGAAAEADARRVDSGHVELWKQIAVETQRRHRMTTPAHLAGQIMAALPERSLAMKVARDARSDRSQRSGATTTSVTLVLGAGALALGVVLGKVFGR